MLNSDEAGTNIIVSEKNSGASSESEVTHIGVPFNASSEIIDVLKECPLFHNFSPIGLNLLGNIVNDRILESGTCIFKQGEKASSFFVVASGEVVVSARNREGRSVAMVSLARSASFGELGGIMKGTRMTTAVATSESRIFEIKRSQLSQMQAEKPQVCVKLMLNVCEMFAQRMTAAEDDFRSYLSWRMGE